MIPAGKLSGPHSNNFILKKVFFSLQIFSWGCKFIYRCKCLYSSEGYQYWRCKMTCGTIIRRFGSIITSQYLESTLQLHAPAMKMRKLWQIFSNERHWSCDGKTHIDFFRLFMGFSSFWRKYKDWSTLFCLCWEMKGHWSRVNLRASQNLHVTSVLSMYFNP